MSTRFEYVSNRSDTPEIALGVAPHATTLSPLVSSLSGIEVQGNLKVKNLSANLLFSDEINFDSLERPSLTGVKEALDRFLYTAPSFSFVRINGNASITLEVGETLTTPTITWSSNKEEDRAITSFTLTRPNGITQTGDFSFKSFSDPGNYTITQLPVSNTQATSSWNVGLVDWKGSTATGSASVNWRYRVYFGVTSLETLTDTQVRTQATTSQLATSRTGLGVKTLNPSNQYFYFAYPQRFNTTSQIRVNGLNFNQLIEQAITSFNNGVGGTDNYYMYRSENKLTASYQIEII
jgi:hypothetical protein